MIMAALLTLIALPLQAAEKPMTDEQKTLYVVGTNVARSLSVFSLTPAELEYVLLGLNEARAGIKPDFDITAYNQKMQDLARARRKAQGEKMAAGGSEFLEKAAKEKNASKTDSGMVYIPLTEGKGASPKGTDTVKVNYRGTLIDGSEFDSSYKRNKPLEFKLNGVIACWTEGVQKMKAGGKARLVCPPNLAYGDNGAGDLILPGATLNFEVELLEVNPVAGAAKPAAPADPAKK
jgi:FKBP-type peptidyl-prolyl cis-trans isomerase FkpA